MAEHGVGISEQSTGAKPPVRIGAGLPIYVGIAPVNSVDPTNVNKPKKCSTLAEFVAQFGPISDDFSWTLHEAAKAHFEVYEVAPIVCINVIDPAKDEHVSTTLNQPHQLVNGKVQLQVYGGPDEPLRGVVLDTVVIKKSAVTKALNVDYTLAFDKDGFLVVSVKQGGSLGNSDVITADFAYLHPANVSADDIIGGFTSGAYTGLEVVKQVFPALRMVPGFLVVPKYSQIPEVAARTSVLARQLNGAFRTMALLDLSTDPNDIATYADAPAWKTSNGYTSVDAVACWPKSKNGSDVYHLSTVLACVANITDAAHNNLPYASPSNKPVSGTSAVLDDGTEVLLEKPQANSLNDQGILTLLNGLNGWRLWGNRTAGYPATTDPKDAFIPIRRMFNWIANTIVLTTDVNIDDPTNRRLIDLVNGTITSFLNSLVAAGALVDGKIEFREDDNPVTDLADGDVKWHVTLTPPPPAESLEFVLEFDLSALEELFA